MNVKKEDIEYTLDKNEIESEKKNKIIQDLENLIEQMKEEKGESKKYFFIGAKTTNNPIFEENKIFLCKIEEGEDVSIIKERLDQLKREYNESKKGKRLPANSYDDLFYNCPKKLFREVGLKVSSYEPIEFVNL